MDANTSDKIILHRSAWSIYTCWIEFQAVEKIFFGCKRFLKCSFGTRQREKKEVKKRLWHDQVYSEIIKVNYEVIWEIITSVVWKLFSEKKVQTQEVRRKAGPLWRLFAELFVIHRIKWKKRNRIDYSNPLEIHRSVNGIHANFAFCSF